MWKKIAFALSAAIIALFAFLYWQVNKAQQEITQLLNQQGIVFEDLATDFFPQPAINLQQAKYIADNRFIRAKQIRLELHLLPTLIGQTRFKQIGLQDGVTQNPDYHSINLSLKPTALYKEDLPDLIHFFKYREMRDQSSDKWNVEIMLSAQNPQDDRVEVYLNTTLQPAGLRFADAKLHVRLARPAYADKQDFSLYLRKGYIGKSARQDVDYEINGVTRINDEDLGYVSAKVFSPNETRPSYLASFTADACERCNTMIELKKSAPHKRIVSLRREYFPLETLLKAFRLPVFAGGKGDIEAELQFDRLQPERGRFLINVEQGKLQGLNFLQLVSQYLPINYSQTNELATPYERFIAVFRWHKQGLLIDDLHLRNKDLLIFGRGRVELDKMLCDVRLNIGIDEPQYQNLSLPMHFFDSCYSPQYKIEINKGLRDQLKHFLKEKLN